ncbi:hypothetical protein M434DRAFT_394249 [Hypoxylon sp. CO27-5]|nr:hypothetical protein M434DRAFT_394249 [Hypoxylon sp. CO27-5]
MATDQPPNIGGSLYSHDETVAAITSYYELVSRALGIATYSKLLYPPPEGWPQLADPDVVTGMFSTEEAMRLMRHIPYFEASDMVQIFPDVEPISHIDEERVRYSAYVGEALRNGAVGQKSELKIPPYMVWLGHPPHEREYGQSLWLDTKLGNVVLGNYHGMVTVRGIGDTRADGIWPDDDSYEDLFVECGIRGYGTPFRIATFFAACERQLRELEWLPGMDEDSGEDGFLLINFNDFVNTNLTYEQRKKIMLDNGWPGDSWNQKGAKKDINRLLEIEDEEDDSDNDGDGEVEAEAAAEKEPVVEEEAVAKQEPVAGEESITEENPVTGEEPVAEGRGRSQCLAM